MKRVVFGLIVFYLLGAFLTACDGRKGEGNIVKADNEVADSAKTLVARADSFKKVIIELIHNIIYKKSKNLDKIIKNFHFQKLFVVKVLINCRF